MDYRYWFNRLTDNIKPYLEEKKIIKEEEPGLKEEIEEAHRQWLEARRYFDSVTEPELVDHATYLIQAAKAKYMYLLNKYKEDKADKEIETIQG